MDQKQAAKLRKADRDAWRAYNDLDLADPQERERRKAVYEAAHTALADARRLYPWAFPPVR